LRLIFKGPSSRHGSQWDDEREVMLEGIHYANIRCDEFAVLLFGQGDVDTVKYADSCRGGDNVGARQEWHGLVELRQGSGEIGKQLRSLVLSDPSLPLGSSQRMDYLEGKEIRNHQLAAALAESVAQFQCFRRVLLDD